MRLAALAIGTTLALVLLEIFVRNLAFAQEPLLPELAARLRHPGLFADHRTEDLYWELSARWSPHGPASDVAHRFDPAIGWLPASVERRTYRHRGVEKHLNGRRPVLLFGDSFALGILQPEDRFEALFEETQLAETLGLLNYGAGGYGIDQTYLLMVRALDAIEHLDPIVIFSLLVDDDLDRPVLSLRGWPKPRLEITREGLRPRGSIPKTLAAHMDARPVRFESCLLRYARFGLRIGPPEWHRNMAIEREKPALCRAILTAARQDLERRELEHFFLIFTGRESSKTESYGWQEPLLRQLFAELEAPFVTTRTALHRASGGRLDKLFQAPGEAGPNHYNVRGNRAALRSIVRGLRGEFDLE